MLTRMTVRNFKRFEDVEIELGNSVVFIGPNNSGKTSAIQALALWELGVKRWNEKRAGRGMPEKRPGVTVNRKDLFAIPHPSAAHLWRRLHTREVQRIDGRQRTSNVRVELVVEGVSKDRTWTCGLEFDYANEESFYCRPLRLDETKSPARMPVPREAGFVHAAFLPPMSGLAATETRLDPGAVDVRIGEGRTAEVLRNLCLSVADEHPDRWESLTERIEALFGVELQRPRYLEARGEITMAYREDGAVLDLSSSGRGLQQTLLILAYLSANPGAVIMLDEPDAAGRQAGGDPGGRRRAGDAGDRLAVGRGGQGQRRVPQAAVSVLVQQARSAQPDGQEELPRTGGPRSAGGDRPRDRREAERHRRRRPEFGRQERRGRRRRLRATR